MTPPTLHLVRARLDAPPLPEERLGGLLSVAERARAARFHFDRDRRRYRVATGLLRQVLGRLVDRPPESLAFDVGPHGKPSLAGGPSFNLSHSGEWWLLGWADEGRVGVDVEVHRSLPDLAALARRSFHPREADRVLALTGAEREAAFFRVWSRKEAFIKALGLGLAYPLDGFEVGTAAVPDPGVAAVHASDEDPASWLLQAVEWEPGLGAAVAWDRPGGSVAWTPAVLESA